MLRNILASKKFIHHLLVIIKRCFWRSFSAGKVCISYVKEL